MCNPFTLEQAISVAEQENFSLLQDYVSSLSYRSPTVGDPEPTELCYVEREKPRSSSNKQLQKCNRCQNLGLYAYKYSVLRPEYRNT